jgi:hypothetical protein
MQRMVAVVVVSAVFAVSTGCGSESADPCVGCDDTGAVEQPAVCREEQCGDGGLEGLDPVFAATWVGVTITAANGSYVRNVATTAVVEVIGGTSAKVSGICPEAGAITLSGAGNFAQWRGTYSCASPVDGCSTGIFTASYAKTQHFNGVELNVYLSGQWTGCGQTFSGAEMLFSSNQRV